MSIYLSTLLAAFLITSLSSFALGQSSLTVAAAADLAAAQPSLSAAFEKSNPSIRLKFVNGASAALAQQIQAGAPFDVFLSANTDLVDELHLNSPKTYAVGHVALLWRDGKAHPISDLAKSEVRFVALPNPTLAPYGRAAQDALQGLGVWDQVKGKLVYGENVRQTLQLFDSGNADAVLTAESLVTDRHAQVIESKVVQKAGIVPASKQADSAKMFLNWLLAPPGQAVLARFGFGRPD